MKPINSDLAFISNEQLVSMLPGNIYWKDIDGYYLGCNNNQLQSLGLNRSELIGKDTASVISSYAVSVDEILENDQSVISTHKEQIYIENIFLNSKKLTYLSKKSPLFDLNKKCVGMIGLSINITQNDNRKNGESLIDLLSQHISPMKDTPALTGRQSECLYLVMRGYTAKDIAHRLGLSTRTVEMHIDTLKNKFYCRTKSQLINKVFSLSIFELG